MKSTTQQVMRWLSKFTAQLSSVSLSLACSTMILAPSAFAVAIDGKLTDSEWQNAQILVLDKTVQPFTLAPAEQNTKVKYFTTEEGIYVGVVSQQAKVQQTAMRTARDSELASDFIELILDFDNSKNTAYGFILGNGGSMRDGIWRDNNQFKSDWDGTWYGKTSQTDETWTAEYLIPWTVAPMAKVSKQDRQIGLYVGRHNVKSDTGYSQVASNAQQPNFIRDFDEIAIRNFASSSFDAFGSVTYQRDMLNSRNSSNLSVDLFWRPDASKQLSVALNPDFGQVESDKLVVNFSPYETFFSERRAFFTENQALFDVQGNAGLRLVHTRRAGVDGDINAAVKYTQNSQHTDFGVMAVFEDDSRGSDEANRFATVRTQHRFDHSQIGYLLTYSAKAHMERKAQVHTVDFKSDVSDSVQISGLLSGSFIDLTSANEHSEGLGGQLNVVHKFSDNWQQSFSFTRFSDDYDVNDFGFLSRNDLQRLYYANERYFNDFSSDDRLKERRLEATLKVDRNSKGLHLETEIRVNGTEEYKDTSSLFWQLVHYTSGNDDRVSRGNGIFNYHSGNKIFGEYNFGNQNKFRHHLAVGLQNKDVDGKGASFHYHPSYYFTDNYRVSWSLWAVKERDRLFWMDDNLTRYRFTSIKNSLDFDATIDDKQELRVRFQWISVTGKEGVKQAIATNDDLYSTGITANDFSRSTTRFQIRYRYEIAPLSNVYLVYSRGGESINDLNQSNLELFSEGWGERTGDNVVAKIRYRF